MADFFFFTELAKLVNQTEESDSFGSISTLSGASNFNTTSVHTASADAKAFAITDGEVYVHPHPNGTHATLVLKPHTQASERKRVDIPRIKYFIYRGIDITQLKSADLIAASGLGVDWIDYIHSTSGVNVDFSTIQIKVNPGLTTATDTPLSYTFFEKNDALNEAPKVYAGDCIGFFLSAEFSMEVVYDDYEYEPKIQELQTYIIDHRIQVTNAGSNEVTNFINGRKKESALRFMDICAFYGANYFSSIKCKDAIGTVATYKEKEIYDYILSKFFNKNAVYLDLRNEVGKSFNYYRYLNSGSAFETERFYPQYRTSLKVTQVVPGIDVDLLTGDYYQDGWPLRKIMLAQVNTGTNETNKNLLKIEMPTETLGVTYDWKFEQTAIVSYGFVDKGDEDSNLKFKEPKNKKRFFDLEINGAAEYCRPFTVPVPNENSLEKIVPVCWYIRILYCRRYLKTGNNNNYAKRTGSNLPLRYFTDAIFAPRDLILPKEVTDGLQFKTFDNDAYIDFSFEYENNQSDFVGKIGWAKDDNYTTLYVMPSISRKKAIKGMSELVSQNYGLDDTATNFLHYLDEKLFYRTLLPTEIEFGTSPDPITKRTVYKFDKLSISPSFLYKKALKKANALIFVMKNENWDAIEQLISVKISDGQINPDLDISLCIVDRNDIDTKTANNSEKYMSFTLVVKAFETSTGQAIPSEFDTGIKFTAKVENDTKFIHTIFIDNNIVSPLLSSSFVGYTCPCFWLVLGNNRPYEYSSLLSNYGSNSMTKTTEFEKMGELIDNIYPEDFIDFITELIQSTIILNTSGVYEVNPGSSHNSFLLYQHVLSKYIKLDPSIPSGTQIFIKRTSQDSAFYPTEYVESYNNLVLPLYDVSTKVQLLLTSDGIKPSSTIAHEGFFLESVFAFALWKIGHDFELIERSINALALWNYGPDGNIDLVAVKSDLDQLRNLSPLFSNLCLSLEKNEINTPDHLSSNLTSLTQVAFKRIMERFALLFDQDRFYTTQIKPGETSKVGWRDRIEEYLHVTLGIEEFNSYRINRTDDAQNRIARDFFAVKKEYLNQYIFCIYEYLGGKGKKQRFFNFASGPVSNFTSNVLASQRGAFLMDLYLESRKTTEPLVKNGVVIDLGGTRESGEIAIVHLGLYGVDKTDDIRNQIKSFTRSLFSLTTSFGFKDFNYRLDTDGTNYWMLGTNQLGYFNVETGDLIVTDPTITSLTIDFSCVGYNPTQLVFNTISVSTVQLANTFSFSKAFEDVFTDDVFQLTPIQQEGIWNLTDPVEEQNLKQLVDILRFQKPSVKVTLQGGFIGKRKLPQGYIEQSYKEDETVLYLDKSTPSNPILKVYQASDDTNTLPTNSTYWNSREYSNTTLYEKGEFVSFDSCVYVAKETFTTSPIAALTSDTHWEKIACLYDPKKDYDRTNLVIGEDKSNHLHLFECLISTKGTSLYDWKYWMQAPEVVSDQRYAFNELDTINPWSPVELAEEIVPPTAGSKKARDFAKSRYAQTQIYWEGTSNTLIIQIEAYASPLISRLDNVIDPAPLPADPSFDRDEHTYYGQDPVAAYNARIPHSGGPIPSYNQLLTALRTLGILEALTEAIKEYVPSGILSEITTKMEAILDDPLTKVNTTTKILDPDIENRSINREIYDSMKL